MPRDRYASLRLLAEVGPELRRLTRQVAAEADRDVTQSAVILAAIAYGLDHVSEVAARLPSERSDTDATP